MWCSKAVHPRSPLHRKEVMSSRKTGRGLFVIALMAALGGPAAAQNIDQGKPASKLFAESCAACHRSARGLAKGRFSLTLYMFLQKHYASNSSSAWALTSYLESVDSAKRAESRAAGRPRTATTGTSRSSLRPPAPVPAR
jgi:mono/diheme cytochrome c family protein